MEGYVWWAVAGIVLIIAEVVTGTFYLLVIGIAALAGAAVAYFNASFWVQAVVAAAVAVTGVIVVGRMRTDRPAASNQQLDIGHTVLVDTWVSEADGVARVTYRNAQWDARVTGERGPPGSRVYYIQSIDGNTLHISAVRPVRN